MTLVDEDVFPSVFSEIPPGPGLAFVLEAQQTDQLDDFDVVEVARSARRLASWAASVELSAVAELSARRKAQGEKLGAWDSEIGEWVTDEIAAALTLSGGTAAHLVVVAKQLTTTLPLTFQALQDSRIDVDKAKVIADGVRGLQPGVAGEVERQVLPAANAQTCGQLRYAVRKAIRDIDPDGCAQRRTMAEDARCLELWDNDAGTSDLAGRNLPATAAAAAWNRINAIAAALKADGDTRTIDQLRADVFVALLRNERPAPEHSAAVADSTRPVAQPTHDLDGAAGDASMPTNEATYGSEYAGQSAGVGDGRGGHGFAISRSDRVLAEESDAVLPTRAVAAAMAGAVRDQLTVLTGQLSRDVRRLGGQAALVREAARRIKTATAELNSRWCTSEQGVRHGAGTYRVPAGMRRLLEARDETCRFPGCRRGADRCDADHTEPHHKGGATCPCNLAMLCRRHHRLKQRPEWQPIQVWPGVLVWIAPTGHWYVTEPGSSN